MARQGTRKLLERAGELRVLAQAIKAARAGTGNLVVIRGVAGLGKSALLASAAAMAAEAGLEVFGARGSELEPEFAFGVVLQLFERPLAAAAPKVRDALLAGAAGLCRSLFQGQSVSHPPGGEAHAFALVHGLHWLASNFAERSPLLLLVDDAQWSDQPSLSFLRYLAQRLHELPISVVLAARPGEPGPPADLLAHIERERHTTLLDLRPLTTEAVRSIVVSRLPGAAEEFSVACAEATGGNPFLLEELLRALASDAVEPTAGNASLVARLAPEAVSNAILARLARLPDAVASAARAAAVLDTESTTARITILAGLDPERAASALDSLAAADILQRGDPPTFVHQLVRSAVYADIPDAERGRMHLRAARVLAGEAVHPELVAAHLLPGQPSGDRWVIDRLREAAGEAAQRAAPQSAVHYLERALEEPPPLELRPTLLVELGEAEAAAGIGAAPQRLESALALVAEPDRRAGIMLRLGWMLHKAGRPGAAADVLERALAELRTGDVPLRHELESAYLDAAVLDSAHAEKARARFQPLLEQHLEADTAADRALLSNVLVTRVFDGRHRDEIVELALRVLGGGRLIEEEGSETMVLWSTIGALSWSDELDLAEETIEAALEDARRRGSVVTLALGLYARCWPRYWRGRIADAAADAQAAVDAWSGDWAMYLPVAASWLALALIERDELDAAEEAVDIPPSEGRWSPAMDAFPLAARGRIAMARGNAETALGEFLAAGELATGTLIKNPAVLPWRSEAAIAAARLGRIDQARQLAAEELTLARRFGSRRPIGAALRAVGLVEDDPDQLEEAVAILRKSPSKLELSRATIELGAMLRRQGQRAAARDRLKAGLDVAQRFGARALERQAEAELAAAGARPRRKAVSGAEALTPSERRVADMAAEGLTNREIAQALFITVKGVQWHLRNSYRKLEIGSRDELGPALRRAQ